MSFIGNRPDSYGYSTTAYEQFSGNSVQTNYNLSRSVSANSDIFVTVDNVPQVPGEAYYITNLNTLTFTGAPGLGTHNIVVVYRNYVQSGIAPGANTVTAPQIAANTIQAYHLSSGLLSPITDIFTANGSTSTFALSQNAVSSNSCTVTVNGITQAYPANYSVSQNVLTFTSAPANNSVIRCVQHAIVGTSVVPIDGSVTTSKLSDASVTIAKLSASGTANSNTYLRGDGTWSIIDRNTVSGNLSVSSNLNVSGIIQSNNGLYTSNNFNGTYTDGIIIDYITGNARISVGNSDGIIFYNNGIANTTILNISSSGNVTTNGIIQSTSGGFKFPDNSTQITAGASTGKAIAMSIVFGG